MSLGSLFAGIGGFDLAARWMGWETKWFSEIEPYACRVLAKHWPGVPNLGDITKIPNPPPIDMLVGGFPCQDISLAGKGEGIEGARSGLWFEFARRIDTCRPRWVVAENVSALRSRGLDRVLGSLAALGYDAEWHCIPAAYVGAPHRRDRIWIVAYPPSGGWGEERSLCRGCAEGSPAEGACRCGPVLGGESVATAYPHTDSEGLQGRFSAGVPECAGEGAVGEMGPSVRNAVCGGCAVSRLRDDTLLADGRWWEFEPDVGRVAHGVPARVDRLRCLGNAIVPQVAYLIFQSIAQWEEQYAV